LDAKKERELNVRLNRNGGRWDKDKLASMGDDTLYDAGFTDSEIIDAMESAGRLDDVEVERAPGADGLPAVTLAFRTAKEYDQAIGFYVGESPQERTAAIVAAMRDGRLRI